ncbi:hypothetical protein O181_049102 [Austropuccinia psidii MF-1]|uniref:Uncharacterized protein n=1 Tax=Austropuccinia psidii MF-1 TaxID=1389203 RepID=A0A9Q3E160_9BASI|nr:hypothetical protein [Austropuccinia psidii MF-1]
MSNPSQHTQQAFILALCSAAHHSTWGGTVTAMCNHPEMGVCGNYSLTSFYGQLAMSSFLWLIGPYWCFLAFGPHHLSLALFGQSSTLPTPNPIPLFWAWGIHLDFQGPLAPWAHPFYYGDFGPFRPPMASMVCGLGPTTYLQGQVGLKPQLDPPAPNLAPNLISPPNGQKDPRTQIGQEPGIGHFQPLDFGNHQRPPNQAKQGFPSIQGKDFSSPMYSVPWMQEWCIYGIIYHYAPILLRGSMVMVSGPN